MEPKRDWDKIISQMRPDRRSRRVETGNANTAKVAAYRLRKRHPGLTFRATGGTVIIGRK